MLIIAILETLLLVAIFKADKERREENEQERRGYFKE